MRYSNICKTLLIFVALAMSISVFGQGRGDGRGDGQGRSERHKGNINQKTKYKNVNAIQIFSKEGTEVYNSAVKPAKSKEPAAKIDWVETNEFGVKIYFVSDSPVQRIIEMKCKECLILVDYKKAKSATSN